MEGSRTGSFSKCHHGDFQHGRFVLEQNSPQRRSADMAGSRRGWDPRRTIDATRLLKAAKYQSSLQGGWGVFSIGLVLN